MTSLSYHAQMRCQQRSIPKFVLDLLLEHGNRGRHRGADVYYFDKQAHKRLKKELGKRVYNRLSDMMNVYAVVSEDERVITGCKRTKRLKF